MPNDLYRCIKIGDKEVEFHPKFRLILHTKLANPHYKPEMQAQACLINFTVTQDGLEDQLLAEVVATERPDLEQQKVGGCISGLIDLAGCSAGWPADMVYLSASSLSLAVCLDKAAE